MLEVFSRKGKQMNVIDKIQKDQMDKIIAERAPNVAKNALISLPDIIEKIIMTPTNQTKIITTWI